MATSSRVLGRWDSNTCAARQRVAGPSSRRGGTAAQLAGAAARVRVLLSLLAHCYPVPQKPAICRGFVWCRTVLRTVARLQAKRNPAST